MAKKDSLKNRAVVFHTLGCCVLISVLFFFSVHIQFALFSRGGPEWGWKAVPVTFYAFVLGPVWWLVLLLVVFVIIRRPIVAGLVAGLGLPLILWLGAIPASLISDTEASSSPLHETLVADPWFVGTNTLVMIVSCWLGCFIMRRLFGPGALK